MRFHLFSFFLAWPLLLYAEVLYAEVLFSDAQNVAAAKADEAVRGSLAEIIPDDLMRHLETLTSASFEGRSTGKKGGYMAGAYAATCFEGFGLVPGGDSNTWFQTFPYTAGFEVPPEGNAATIDWGSGVFEDLRIRDGYAPLTFSPNRSVEAAGLVFAGYGIRAGEAYDNYKGLDVKGKWVMVFRGKPSAKKDKAFRDQQSLVAKAHTAKKLGALGLVYVKSENKAIPAELTQFTNVGQKGRILPAISIRNKLADTLVGRRKLSELYGAFDRAEEVEGFALEAALSAAFTVREKSARGRNVIGILPAGDEPGGPAVVLCAHIDHLGYGKQGGSRAKGRQRNALHPGADDNASGTAALFEVAQALAARKAAGELELERDIAFIAFSGEELGLWGSRFHVEELKQAKQLKARVHSCLNLDMIGRLRDDTFTLTGLNTSEDWNAVLDTVAAPEGLTVKRVNRAPGGDSLPFSRNGIPALFGITGMHDEYHTPADTLDKLNVPGLALISTYLADVATAIARHEGGIAYKPPPAPPKMPDVLIGLVLEDAEDPGALVKSVSDGLPGDQAGIQIGDVITRMAGTPVKDLEGLFGVLRTLKADQEVPVEVQRDGEALALKITPIARS